MEQTKDVNTIWNNCLKFIEDNIEPQDYKNWFTPIVPLVLNKATLTIQVPSASYYECLENNYYKLLKTAIKKELGVNGKLNYKVLIQKTDKPETEKSINLPSTPKQAVSNPGKLKPIDIYRTPNKDIPDPFVLPGLQKRKIPSNLISSMNFDNYIEGDCNRLVRAAGWAISQKPGNTAFNPLFIYSDAGLGKTHLAHAIGLQTKENFPDKVVLYVGADLFYQQFIEAVKNNNRDDFIYFYQSVDVLIIDDIQFLGTGNKEKTQEALFYIFNHFQQHNKQLIICSDKSPVEISGFEQRLLSRFKWGLAADLQIPDLETRIAILKSKLANNGVEFPEEVINYLALRVTSNTRELEGAMIAILAQASLNRREITEDLAKEMIDKYVKSTAKEISIEYIQKVVCDYFGIAVDKINANTRKREIVQARQFCMFFAKKYTKLPLSTIGKYCGDKDHATVLHSCRVIENLLDTDKKIRSCAEDIEKKMKV
ncbi:MAG: chromosomal replication initiator protein DnaA [Bacteroidales bacterium]|nr:chromosomal replication initiator protein DnaA [Bacteroidales bacterium]